MWVMTSHEIPGQGGVVFWGILALVVVVLLVIISRLLPKSPPTPGVVRNCIHSHTPA